MKKYLPILFVILFMSIVGYVIVQKKTKSKTVVESQVPTVETIGTFVQQQSCIKPPPFLENMGIPQPVVIDLSQQLHKGIALHYGKNFSKTIHPKQWEQYGHLSTYALDKKGNIFLAPMPFISIQENTFDLQKNIYKLDGETGQLSIFMHFNDVFPSARNPYGISAIVYDCEDNTLWVSAIDSSTFAKQKGRIYHIDIEHKKILQEIKGVDVLSMQVVKSSQGKFLLFGSARDGNLYAYAIKAQELYGDPFKLLELPYANKHIRKIKITDKNTLELQAISFNYSLVAQSTQEHRVYYDARWTNFWTIYKNSRSLR